MFNISISISILLTSLIFTVCFCRKGDVSMSATTICGQSFASSLQVKRYPAIRPGIIIDTPDVLRPKFFVVGIDSFGSSVFFLAHWLSDNQTIFFLYWKLLQTKFIIYWYKKHNLNVFLIWHEQSNKKKLSYDAEKKLLGMGNLISWSECIKRGGVI